jgi:hypothetical protein
MWEPVILILFFFIEWACCLSLARHSSFWPDLSFEQGAAAA